MIPIAIIDTSVYLEHYRHGSYKKELSDFGFLIRSSSVVLSELFRGCRKREEERAIQELADSFPIITPTEKNWIESGQLLANLSNKKGYSTSKLRDLHFDILIALSARNVGAVVITMNRSDFEEIRKLRDFKLICWS